VLQGDNQVDDRGFNKTTLGMINAMAKIADSNQKLPKQKRVYVDGGVAIHLKQCHSTLTPEERVLDIAGRRTDLPPKKITVVPIKRELRIDFSRYPAEKLREIRAGKTKSGEPVLAGARERNRRMAKHANRIVALAAE
jgi:hypothetical protein